MRSAKRRAQGNNLLHARYASANAATRKKNGRFPQGLAKVDRRCDTGERRVLVLHQLKRLLSDDCLVWHDIPVGTQARQPDFFIFSPRQGLLALEVKETRRPGWR